MSNSKKRLARIEELLSMAANQSADNRITNGVKRKEFRAELRASAAAHDREMKEIRGLFKKMIQRKEPTFRSGSM